MSIVDVWTGRRATALRQALRMTNEGFAAHLGVAPRTVANWAARPDMQPTMAMRAVLDTALARAPSDVQERFSAQIDEDVSVGDDREVQISSPAAVDVAAWELTDALTRASISGAALDELERVTLHYAAHYGVCEPTPMVTPVNRMMARLRDTLDLPQPVAVRRRCVRLLGVLAGVAANLAVDIGRLEDAIAFYEVGRAAGREGEDRDLMAWVTANQSIGSFFAGETSESVTLLEKASALAEHSSSERRQAWIAGMYARALAANHQPVSARRTLDQAHTLLNSTSEPPQGTDFFDWPRLEGVSGSCMLLLHDAPDASALLSNALEHRSDRDIKGRALLTLDLASCRVLENEPEEATRLAGEALGVAEGTVVQPIVERTAKLRSTMYRWEGSSTIAELDTRIAATVRRSREA